MPPDGKLSDAERAVLNQWIERGALFPESTEPDAEASQPAKVPKPIDIEAGRDHWAFRPFSATPIPPTRESAVTDGRIDAFILARLEAAGLPPGPEADPRSLLTRLSFDLLGLPPTEEELKQYLADDSPEAYSRAVERMLASPRHGERYGRYWLDLVRYCDKPESWAELGGQAWLYRDWVTRALNEDLPYDRFVTKQLAADLEEGCDPADIAALGLLGLGPSYWKELKLAPGVIETVVAEEWEEGINALSSGLLGLTVACARCHDHKFDPITSEDYYALAGVLASTRRTPLPLSSPEEARKVGAAHQEAKFLESEIQRFNAIASQTPAQAEEMKAKVEAAKSRVEALKRDTPHFDDPLAYAVEDAALFVTADGPDRTKLDYRPGESRDVAIQIRGNPAKVGPLARRGFPRVLASKTAVPYSRGSGRWELAQSIFTDAAPLAARVIVNRVWKYHFGRGLVDSTSNFGTQGDRPTHPELLDDLASRFVAHGWSFKWLHREIVMSAAYRRASAATPKGRAIDPANRLYSHANRTRLDVEAWRDRMLSVAGVLDVRLGGPPVEMTDPANNRRTLYATVKRRDLDDLLRLYDFPDPTSHSPGRDSTITPLQQLFLLNGDFVAKRVEDLRGRLAREFPQDASGRLERAYTLILNREPTPRERELGLAYVAEAPLESPAADELWRQYLQVLLAQNEFMFVE